MRTKKTLIALAVAGMACLGAASAQDTFNFTFTSFAAGGMDATGTFTVVDGVAQMGSINVTGVPIEATPTIMISASGNLVPDTVTPAYTTLVNHDGDDENYDNLVNLGNNPILDSYGLGFAAGPYQDAIHYNTLINLWGNSPGSYSLFVAEAELDANGNPIGPPILDANGNPVLDANGNPKYDYQWVYDTQDGSLTFTAVPESATYGALAGAVLLVVALGSQWRRKQA